MLCECNCNIYIACRRWQPKKGQLADMRLEQPTHQKHRPNNSIPDNLFIVLRADNSNPITGHSGKTCKRAGLTVQ